MKLSGNRLPIFFLFLWAVSFGQQRDTTAHRKERSPFADTQELTSSDYLAAIERANDLMNTVADEGQFKPRTFRIFGEISNTNESIGVITQNIKDASNTNVRNQRMYQKVLLELEQKLESYQTALNKETGKIVDLRKKLRTVMKDTVFRKMIRDTVIRKQFQSQLKPLRKKFFAIDSILKGNLKILDTHKNENTRKEIVISEALVTVEDRLDKLGISIFGSEYPNLWDTRIKIANQNISSFIAEKFSVEVKAFSYYFTYSLGRNTFLLLLLALFYWWLKRHIRRLREQNQLQALDEFGFRALNRGVLLPVVVIGLNIAIAVNLYAPALYIEFLHLLLLVILSVLFRRKWQPKAYRRWLLLVGIFIAFSFLDLFLKVTLFQRCLFIGINVVAIRFGLSHLKYLREELYIKVMFKWANYLFIAFNVLAVLFNLFGRVSLAYTLSLTAIIALTQMIALSVMLRIILEIVILQVYVIRLKRGITKLFDFEKLERNALKPFLLIVVYLWIVVIASNLNLSDSLSAFFGNVAGHQNKIGSFTFTIGGILLFVAIIWIAHLLQKFVAFFFGGIEENDTDNINKRQHSKLLITRLLLLVGGYLLAIAASGMPIDKITIVLGALGVGVGLGLQSIVSNFVSGVILIFERPIQIGDMIESGNQSGRVKEIGLRTTTIDTADGAEVIIPNANILSQNIINWTTTDNYRQAEISFAIAAAVTRKEIKDIILESLKTVPELDAEAEPEIFFHSMSGNRFRVKVKFWCNIYRKELATSEAEQALFEGFAKKEILMED
ncbi:MAG TPA: mechanosensitive ion channel domain-containing protein [Flavobacterium sp.]|nr:mechanosensitive ion channel domain-containing protein [Flavobacterium sp.]